MGIIGWRCVRVLVQVWDLRQLLTRGTDQDNMKTMPIHKLSDNDLLEIFDLCRTGHRDKHYRNLLALFLDWKFVNVCQRWRDLIFASSSRLDLELICSDGTPIRKYLGCWPAFPIIIEYDKVAPGDKDNLIATLEHPDRVRRVTVSGVTRPLWEKMDAAMQKPFPSLTHLQLTGSKDQDQPAPVLPSSLLGGDIPCLVELYLRGISFPALPKLLLSASELVHLDFVNIPPTCYIPPEALATGLTGLTRLKTLAIEFRQAILLADQDHRIPAPAAPAVSLPTLDTFGFKGFCEFLEDLVAQIDAPRVTTFSIIYFGQPVYQVPQLARFLRRSDIMPSGAQVQLILWVNIMFYGQASEKAPGDDASGAINLSFLINTSGMVRAILHSVQVLQQISALLSGVTNLGFNGPAPPSNQPPYGGSMYSRSPIAGTAFGEALFGDLKPLLELPGVQDSVDRIDWRDLLRPFPGVLTLNLHGELSECVVRALEWLNEEMAAHILPALRTLRFTE